LAQAIIIWIFRELFGDFAVVVLPITLLGLLIFAIYKLLRAIEYHGIIHSESRVKTAILAFFMAALLEGLFYSFYDFSLFFTAAAAHSLALVFMIVITAIVIKNFDQKIRIRNLIAIFIFTVLCGTLNEFAGTYAACLAIAACLYSIFSNRKFIFRSNRQSIVIFVAGIIGFLTIYFSPGSVGRRAGNSPHFGIIEAASGAFHDYGTALIDLFTSYRLVFLIAALLITIAVLKLSTLKTKTPKFSIGKVSILLLLCGLFPLVIFFVANYSIGYTAMRLTNIVDVFILSFVIILVSLLSRFLKSKTVVNVIRCVVPFFAAVAAVVIIIYLFIPVIKAENRRNDLVVQRTEYMTRNEFLPAPLLLSRTEAIDVTYYPKENAFGTWNLDNELDYYGLPHNSKIIAQPKDYCLNYSIYDRTGKILAKSCGNY
jgi:hypothetical protein